MKIAIEASPGVGKNTLQFPCDSTAFMCINSCSAVINFVGSCEPINSNIIVTLH